MEILTVISRAEDRAANSPRRVVSFMVVVRKQLSGSLASFEGSRWIGENGWKMGLIVQGYQFLLILARWGFQTIPPFLHYTIGASYQVRVKLCFSWLELTLCRGLL